MRPLPATLDTPLPSQRVGAPALPVAARRHWPLAIALIALWTTLAAVLVRSLAQNAGHLVYDVDDPYIHMAIAKHVVQHGVWGVTPYAFSSAASSIVWPLLLVGIYAVVGISEAAPLVLNVLAATALLAIAYGWLSHRAARPAYILAVLLVMVYLTPLPALVFSGHEHVAHAALTVAFSGAAAATLASPSRGPSALLLGLAPLLVGARYEGLFLVAVTSGLLLVQRRLRLAVGLAGLAVLPAVLIGLVSIGNGWFALPTSLVLKGRLLGLAPGPDAVVRLGRDVYHDLLASPHLLLLLVAALALFGVRISDPRAGRPELFGLLLFSGAAALHVVFAGRVRWFYRHDAYLVALGLVALAPALDDAWRAWRPHLEHRPAALIVARGLALGLLAAFFVLPVAWRGTVALLQRGGSVAQVAQATTNIYEQQYQMGLFLQQHYAGASVALNDVGATDFLADLRLLDLYGLASLDVARLKLNGEFDRPHLAALAKANGVRIAIVYDHWFQDGDGSSLLPAEWRRVALWTIPHNVSAGGDTVAFYAADASAEAELRRNLRDFGLQLPAEVSQSGPFLVDHPASD